MKQFLIILLFCLPLTGQGQSFYIGSTTITFSDPSRSNRLIATDIYYPASTNGTNVAVGGTEKFPVVVFGHGFSMTVDAYQNIWSTLVPNGYIVALPKTEGGLFPNHANFGKDLAYVVTAIQNRGSTSGNLFTNRIASSSCVMGHSMGGGCAVLAMQYNPNITTLSALAPAETNTSAIGAASNTTKPALLFTGGSDCVTPTSSNGGPIYSALASTCKTMINVIGGSHCQFANSNFNCSLGETTCSSGPSISRSTQHTTVNRYLLPWLNFRLKNYCTQWTGMQTILVNDVTVSYQQNCPAPFSCTLPINTSTTAITAGSAVANWSATSCNFGYQVRFRKTNTTSWTTSGIFTGLQYTINNLQNSTNYEWQVRSVCDTTTGGFSSWTTARRFKTLANRVANPVDQNATPGKVPSFFTSIQPNPGNGNFVLKIIDKSERPISVHVFNAIGSLILTYTISVENGEDYRLDLSDERSGIYFVRCSNGTEQSTHRIILE